MENKVDKIYLVWGNDHIRRKFVVGTLEKENGYKFYYSHHILDAIKEGFEPLIPFPDIDKEYFSDRLFPTFACRLPDKQRKDMSKILKKYGMKEYDQFEMLKRGGARLPIDDLEFIKGP